MSTETTLFIALTGWAITLFANLILFRVVQGLKKENKALEQQFLTVEELAYDLACEQLGCCDPIDHCDETL